MLIINSAGLLAMKQCFFRASVVAITARCPKKILGYE